MSKINLCKEPDGWWAYIESGRGTLIVDGFFNDEFEAADAVLGPIELVQVTLKV